MAWNVLQQESTPSYTASGGSSTKTKSFPSGVTAGNLLVVFVFNDGDEAVTGTPTDTVGTIYAIATSLSTSGFGFAYIYWGICGGAGTNANTFSVTFASNAGGTHIWPLEISGNASSSPFDVGQHADGTVNSTTVVSGATAATAVASELAVSFIITGTGDTAGLPGGWSGYNDDSVSGILSIYQTVTSSGSTPQASWTQSPSGNYQGLIAAFKPSSGASYIYPGPLTSPSSSLSGLTAVKRVLRPNITRF